MSTHESFLDTLRNAGATAGDSEELRLQKSLLFFATGLISFASMLWLFIYAQLGPQFSSTIPFIFQFLLIGNLAIYLKTLNFDAFRLIQLSIFLFLPFVAQWSMGNFITASGVSLWGLLAPVGAVLFIGPRESSAWFFAYLFLTALSGGFDYYLADSLISNQPKIPTHTTIFFFALNFAAVYQSPCVLFCQNNQWAISVPISKQSASETLAQKGKAYGMPYVRVDGNDVLAVYSVTKAAADRARAVAEIDVLAAVDEAFVESAELLPE